MERAMTYLVTGARGHVGRHVVAGLAVAGVPVRAMSRNPAALVVPAGVEVVDGDLTDPAGLGDALRGVEAMYLFPEPSTATEVVDRAVQAGVRRIVVLSSSSVTQEGNHSGVYHRTVELAVQRSGVEATFVRPDEFATNILWKWGSSIRRQGVVRGPYRRAKRALLHEADIADVVVAALVQDGHAGQTYTLTGPEALNQAEQVAAVARGIGRDIAFVEVDAAQARADLVKVMPAPVVDMVLEYLAASVDEPTTVLPTVEMITGRPGRTLEQWARDHAVELAPERAAPALLD